MSKSVDETVFDFFSVLLQEPSEVGSDSTILAPDNTDTNNKYINTNVQVNSSNKSVLEKGIKSSSQELIPSVSVRTKEPEQKKFAQPTVDKDALSKLLSAVSKPNIGKNSAVSVQQSIKDKAEQIRQKLVSVQVDEMEPALSKADNKGFKNSADIDINKAVNTEIEQSKELFDSTDTELSSVPPSITISIQEVLDDEFQVLFFNVAGLTLAVPLVSLGGIVKIEHINHLIGRPKWFLGVQTRRDQKVNVVDSCQWVMPEKYTKELADSIDYQYIVMLEDSDWGLACESLVNAVKIEKSHVNWREKAGKRPWLAGVVKEQMCGILNVQALIEMLDAGLGCQDSID